MLSSDFSSAILPAWYSSLLPYNSRQVTIIGKISIAQGCLWESMYFIFMLTAKPIQRK